MPNRHEHAILFGGLCSGKTTAANHAVEKFGYIKISLAAELKALEETAHRHGTGGQEFCDVMERIFRYQDLCPTAPSSPDTDYRELTTIVEEALSFPREPVKPRRRLQHIGEQARQRIQSLFWVHITHGRILHESAGNRMPYIIDDGRYLNEYEYFLQQGFNCFKIATSVEVQIARARRLFPEFREDALQHPSEQGIHDVLQAEGGIQLDGNVPAFELLQNLDYQIILRRK